MLKGQDVILLILLRFRSEINWTYADLSHALGISVSQCHLAVGRLQKTRLLASDAERMWNVSESNFEEYVIHALKYDFPGEIGPVARGIPTVHSANFVARNFFPGQNTADATGEYVWPSPTGTMKGNSLQPIHACQIKLVGIQEHPNLALNGDIYEFLVCIDLLRIGRAREQRWARDLIRKWPWKT